MITFKQFLEVKRARLTNNLPPGFSIKRLQPVRPDENDKYAVIDPRANLPKNIQKYSGQIVAIDRTTFSNDHHYLWICPLDNKDSEGLWFRVNIHYLLKPTEEELSHAKWLEKTFFIRDNYSKEKTPLKYIPWSQTLSNYIKIMTQIKDPEISGFLNDIETSGHLINTWLIIADKLEDLGYDVENLRSYINEYK